MEPFLGQIILFAGNFAPRGWQFCHGQLLPINSWNALFSILGTTYGGDGRTTFSLPDLKGAVAVGQGQRPGQPNNYRLGQKGGSDTNQLVGANLPAHSHSLMASSNAADVKSPAGAFLPSVPRAGTEFKYASTLGTAQKMGDCITSSGSGFPMNNVQPYTALNYIICTNGIYPSRS